MSSFELVWLYINPYNEHLFWEVFGVNGFRLSLKFLNFLKL